MPSPRHPSAHSLGHASSSTLNWKHGALRQGNSRSHLARSKVKDGESVRLEANGARVVRGPFWDQGFGFRVSGLGLGFRRK